MGQERRLLTPLPETLPEPFDVVVRGRSGSTASSASKGAAYSVPFRFVGREVEVRGAVGAGADPQGCSRDRRARPAGPLRPARAATRPITTGKDTERVRAPMPLGRMGRRLAGDRGRAT